MSGHTLFHRWKDQNMQVTNTVDLPRWQYVTAFIYKLWEIEHQYLLNVRCDYPTRGLEVKGSEKNVVSGFFNLSTKNQLSFWHQNIAFLSKYSLI